MKLQTELLETLIGMSETDAYKLCKENGYASRTTIEDGKPYIITCDLRFDRVNFEIENGLVTKANIG
jgi:hypothetical protein